MSYRPPQTPTPPDYEHLPLGSPERARGWALWHLRQLHALGLKGSILATQLKTLLHHGLLDHHDAERIATELTGGERYRPTPRQLDLTLTEPPQPMKGRP